MYLSESFLPDWVSPPGETIRDVLRERSVSIDDFADLMGQSREEIADLIQGRTPITLRIARLLERVLGASVEFWMSREFRYRQHVGSAALDDNAWLQSLPVADMLKLGWLSPVPERGEILSSCLRFFGVPNIATWYRIYGSLAQQYAFRTSPSFESKPGALLAWLRQGELEGEKIACAPWNPLAFKNGLDLIRSLTREGEPNEFAPKLRDICSEAGVAVAIVRSPTGSRASGATRFLSKNKALLLLSFRYLSDDQFWFSFFHEAGHLLLHGHDDVFIEGIDGDNADEEKEASDFAFHELIPREFESEFFQLPQNSFAYARFARRIGIAPGLVVGQLQHYGKIKPGHFNGLKRRYKSM